MGSVIPWAHRGQPIKVSESNAIQTTASHNNYFDARLVTTTTTTTTTTIATAAAAALRHLAHAART
ncbi:hypothetical protein E2C01_000915 [Portunus trituberculatus]|uniref:Uncharacterized protein n=1 Tax=Portunus trituberculatus TaxID=210409 RepID=A0A5B7CL74_PORTR|nr:hypothetical protein [Portunus trituberculatus]